MAVSTMAFPVDRDKLADLRAMLNELNGPRHAQTAAVHQRAGVHERGFLQTMADGRAIYVVVFESDDADGAIGRVMHANASDPEYGPWIFARLQHVFQMDPSQGTPPTPECVYDSEVQVRVAV